MNRKTRRAVGSITSDAGSALPLLIAGIMFLVLLGAALLGSLQLLEQQRRLNGLSDTVALDLTATLARSQDLRAIPLEGAHVIRDLYPDSRATIVRLESTLPASVALTVCEPSKPTMATLLGFSAKQVCARSKAASR